MDDVPAQVRDAVALLLDVDESSIDVAVVTPSSATGS